MIIVSDTSPLIALLKADSLWILERLFTTVYIPKGVYDELIVNSYYINEAQTINNCDFINIIEVSDQELVLNLQKSLDKGESQAIALAKELNADLLIDERKGRREAIKYDIQIIGTVGVLKYAYKNNLLSLNDIMDCKTKMISSKIRISEELFDTIFND